MRQVDGLCSPGSATSSSSVRFSLKPASSQTVTFPAVPLVTGEIPVTIAIYDIEEKIEVDAIQKILLVKVRGSSMGIYTTFFVYFVVEVVMMSFQLFTYSSFSLCLRTREWK